VSRQYGFSFDQTKCIQCHGCELACKTWRQLEIGIRWRQVKTIWSGDYPTVKNLSLSLACMHCHDPQCIKACPEDAISKRAEDGIGGIVVVDPALCTGCQACQAVCPFDVPQYGSDGKMQKCDMCHPLIDLETLAPPCVATCPTAALGIGLMTGVEKREAEKAHIAIMQEEKTHS
jgi:anaerobic dimethyl sulfoxide reductase subunit B (iron-sulfur subunit)